MAQKIKKTPTRAEQAKLKKENAKRAKIMAAKRRDKTKKGKGRRETEKEGGRTSGA